MSLGKYIYYNYNRILHYILFSLINIFIQNTNTRKPKLKMNIFVNRQGPKILAWLDHISFLADNKCDVMQSFVNIHNSKERLPLLFYTQIKGLLHENIYFSRKNKIMSSKDLGRMLKVRLA